MEKAISKTYQYAEPNLTVVGWMGFLGFPLYYLIWTYVFPQVYDSLFLRTLGSLLFFSLAFRNKLKPKWRKHFYLHLYYQGTITFGLPFFFFYMLLMNDWSIVWIMSVMAAISLHILLVHITWIMTLQTVIGISFAVLCAWINQGFSLDFTMNWSYVPVFLFLYVFGNLFYFRNQNEHESNVSIAKSFGASIAHEMRNPLSTLYSSMDIIQSIIPKEDNKDVLLQKDDISSLNEVIKNAINSIQSGNETIDLLLTSIDENKVSRSTFKKYKAESIVINAIQSFSYKNSVDRFSITFQDKGNFDYFGSDTLLKYILFNIFKNAYRHRSSNNLKITVTLKKSLHFNYIQIKDNGPGIDPKIIPHIFHDFYTTGTQEHYGLGLPFCKKVMTSFGGDILCKSKRGEGALFTVIFPLINSKKITGIQHELCHLKSVFILTQRPALLSEITKLSRSMGFNLETMNIKSALKKEEYEFEYDLLFIDIDSINDKKNQLEQLESKLTFTEARIIYLFQNNPIDRSKPLSYKPLCFETQTWLQNSKVIINNLFFYHWDIYSEPEVEKKQAEQKKRTILFVEDSKALRQLTSILLEKEGFNVIQCSNGLEIIGILNAFHVNLILMDIEMPIMNGIEISRKIRASTADYSTIPIIAYTGDSSCETLKKMKQVSISDFIIKPVDKNKLIDKINSWI